MGDGIQGPGPHMPAGTPHSLRLPPSVWEGGRGTSRVPSRPAPSPLGDPAIRHVLSPQTLTAPPRTFGRADFEPQRPRSLGAPSRLLSRTPTRLALRNSFFSLPTDTAASAPKQRGLCAGPGPPPGPRSRPHPRAVGWQDRISKPTRRPLSEPRRMQMRPLAPPPLHRCLETRRTLSGREDPTRKLGPGTSWEEPRTRASGTSPGFPHGQQRPPLAHLGKGRSEGRLSGSKQTQGPALGGRGPWAAGWFLLSPGGSLGAIRLESGFLRL